MALCSGKTHYCAVNVSENGNVINRRVHVIRVLTPDGRRRFYSGSALPDSMSLETSKEVEGHHVMDMFPSEVPKHMRPWLPAAEPWPKGRDCLHVFAGMVGLVIMNGVFNALQNWVIVVFR